MRSEWVVSLFLRENIVRGARTAPTWCLTPRCGVRNRIVWAGAGPVRERSSFLGNRADSEMVKCATTATERTAVWQKEWRHWRRQVVCLLSQRSIRGCLPLEEGQGLGRHRCAFPPSLPWPQKQWKQNCRGLPRTSGVVWPQIASPLLLFWYFLYLTWLFMLAIWLV